LAGWTVKYFVDEGGSSPFEDWVKSLKNYETRKRLYRRVNKLRQGNLGHCKAIGDGVTELIEDFGPGFRIYIGRDGTQVVILLCGGDKASQNDDIRDAKQYLKNYRQRKE
jgi:putative addiction module killer protein